MACLLPWRASSSHLLDDRDVGGTEDGSTAAAGDYAGQARKALENLRAALTDASASIDDVISTRISVASAAQGDLSTVWEVVHDRSPTRSPEHPGRCNSLGYHEQLVEIEAVAAVPA
ncbi:MAG: hypothetical protein H0T91_08625 [Propionibacteriaceae bacterium]|nr:hypothetical protein [Propionibacteriaceae bacterium]